MSKPKLTLELTAKEAKCLERLIDFAGRFDLHSGPLQAADGLERRQNFNLYVSLGTKLWQATNQFKTRHPDV